MMGLPDGWVSSELGDLAAVDWGDTSITKKSYIDEGYVAFSAAGSDGYLASYQNEGEAIILSAIGAGCGKCFLASGKWTAIKNTIIIKPAPSVSNSYLFRFLNNPKSWKVSGSGQPFITLGTGRKTVIPLPPSAEQTRIAQKLDELLSHVDFLKARIDAFPILLKRFRQSVLAAAVSGRLTDNGDGFDLPLGWQKIPFSVVINHLRYGTSKKCDYNGGKSSVLRIPNIGDEGIDVNDLKSADFSESEIEKLSLIKGDVVLIRSNGSIELVGKSAVVSDQEEGLLFAGYLIRVRPDIKQVLPEYVNFWLKSPPIRQVIELTARSTSGVNNINSEEIKSLPFIMPPLNEQTEIVGRVEQLFAFADQLEAKVAAAKNRIDYLTQSILAKAFRGELVPQDPNDEPASVLLERIKAQRAAAPKVKRGCKVSV